MKKLLDKIFVYFLAFVIGIISGFFIAYELIQKNIAERSIKISKEYNKIA